MKTKSFMTFSIIAILLTAVGAMSLSASQSIFAQNNNTTAGMNAPNQGMMATKGNQNMPMGMNYQNSNMVKKNVTVNGSSINIMNTMYQAIASKMNVSLPQAINTAEKTIGNKSYAMEAATDVKNGYIEYSIILGTPDMKFYNVVVDPGNGKVLSSHQLSTIDGMMMMHSGMNKGNGMMMQGWNNQDNGMMGMKNGFDKNGHNNNQGQW